MITGFEISSNFAKSMQRIHEVHWESGNEAHSKAGNLIKKAISGSLEKKKTPWTTEIVNGKRRIVKGSFHSMGERRDHKTGAKLSASNMSNFVQWQTYSTTGTTVIGGKFKNGTTEIRRNGKIVGRTRVHAVHQDSIDILEKMDSGNVGKALWNKQNGGYSTESKAQFDGTHKNHPAHFIAEGKSKGLTAAKNRIPRYMVDALRNRENIKKESMEKL